MFRIRFCIFYNRSELTQWLSGERQASMTQTLGTAVADQQQFESATCSSILHAVPRRFIGEENNKGNCSDS